MSDAAGITQALLETAARHLPPSPSTLHLADVGGRAGAVLAALRQDIAAHVVDFAGDWPLAGDSADAVLALDAALTEPLLRNALAALRPGGRLIIVASTGSARAELVTMLEAAGFTRILVEPALADGRGLLLRGEKPHTTADTLARVNVAASRDAAYTDFAAYPGRYVHLLVRQTPNKPVWALRPDETVTWHAAAIQTDDGPALLAFSGLPRAVAFMQPAVLAGQIGGVGKVARFSRATARTWTVRVLLNPPVDVLERAPLAFIEVDPATAEAPEE